jgi:hypothetical protein
VTIGGQTKTLTFNLPGDNPTARVH